MSLPLRSLVLVVFAALVARKTTMLVRDVDSTVYYYYSY